MECRTNLHTPCHPIPSLLFRPLHKSRSRHLALVTRALPEDKQPPGADKDNQKATRSNQGSKVKGVHNRVTAALSRRLEQLMVEVMPQERGDARDWALMWTSVAIFVYASMHLYRLYAYAYYSLGLRPLTHLLGH